MKKLTRKEAEILMMEVLRDIDGSLAAARAFVKMLETFGLIEVVEEQK